MSCNINEDRRIIQSDIHDYLDTYNLNKILVLKNYPGVGKTYATMSIVNECDQNSIYLSPTHILSQEISEMYEYEHMKGKSLCCINKEKLDEVGKFCNTNIYCKMYCPHYLRCEYYLKIRNIYDIPQPWVGVHSHITNLFDQYTERNYGLVDISIIDETFMSSLFKTIKIRRENLLYLRDFTIYENLIELIEETLKIMNNDSVFDNEYITGLIRDFDAEMLNKESERLDIELLNLYFKKEPMKYKKNNLGIFKELSSLAKNNYLNEGFLQIDNNYFDLMYNSRIKNKGSMILLDATFEKSINEQFFSRGTNFDIKELQETFTNRQNRYQFKEKFRLGERTNTYPMSTLFNKEFTSSFYTLSKLAKLICEKHSGEETLIISRKKHGILDKIKEEVNMDNVAYLNYGASRGINQFKDYKNVILFGTPFPNPSLVSRKAKVLGVDEDYVMKIEREDEMFQSLFRIRPLGKDCNIYVFSSLPIFRDTSGIIYSTPTEMIKMLENKLPLNLEKNDVIKSKILEILNKEGTIKKADILGLVTADNVLTTKCLNELISSGKIIEKPMRVGKSRSTIFLEVGSNNV